MGKFSILLFLLAATLPKARAQTWEGGIFMGASNYKGDIAPTIDYGETHFSYGILGKANINRFWSIQLAYQRAYFSADEANYGPHARRMLSFESQVDEIGLTAEYHFLPFRMGHQALPYTPYFFTGVSYIGYVPKAKLGGESYVLQQNPTEGQGFEGPGEERSSNQITFPVGMGFKFALGRKWDLAVHAATRILTNDYFDDVGTGYPNQESQPGEVAQRLANPSLLSENPVSDVEGKQRGDHMNTDYLYFTGISITYKLSDPTCYRF